MKLRVPDYFDEFKCIADKCEDTCCAGWGIVIDNESYEKYQKVQGEFGDILRKRIIKEEGDNIFALKDNNCSFLNESKMCDIYTELGEDSLCYTCREFPRFREEFGKTREVGISLSCPEAARIILRNSNKVKFIVRENDEEVSNYNDINATLYMELLQCRKIIIDILQNDAIELNDKMAIVLKFADDIQEKIDSSEINKIKEIKENYLQNDFVSNTIASLKVYSNNGESKYTNIREYFQVFKELKHINPYDPLELDFAIRLFWTTEEDKEIYLAKAREFNIYNKENEYKLQNILVYFVFRYFMKAVFDYDVLAKVKTAIISTIMIRELSMMRWVANKELIHEDIVQISQIYSKDIEHLEENIETLAELFETNEKLSVNEMIKTILS